MTSRKGENVSLFPVFKSSHTGALWGCSQATPTCCMDSKDWVLRFRTVGLEAGDVAPQQWPMWQRDQLIIKQVAFVKTARQNYVLRAVLHVLSA